MTPKEYTSISMTENNGIMSGDDASVGLIFASQRLRILKNRCIGGRSIFTKEALALKVKVQKWQLIIVGVYKPLSMLKSQRKLELNTLFESAPTL